MRVKQRCVLLILLLIGSDGCSHAQEKPLLLAINDLRSHGTNCADVSHQPAAQLTWNSQLAQAAKQHARAMAEHNTLSHSVANNVSERLAEVDYHWSHYAENIASGYSNASQVISAWQKSNRHCRNLMNANYIHLGTAEYQGYWVALFASPNNGNEQIQNK
jgi:uncharacterized protein YkwD